MQGIAIVEADLGNPQHQDAIVHLVDAYARDPMGGGKALPEEVRTALIPGLAAPSYDVSISRLAQHYAGGDCHLLCRVLDVSGPPAHQHP